MSTGAPVLSPGRRALKAAAWITVVVVAGDVFAMIALAGDRSGGDSSSLAVSTPEVVILGVHVLAIFVIAFAIARAFYGYLARARARRLVG